MPDSPTHHDAELLLRVFDLRREKRLRDSRDFMLQKCWAQDYASFKKKYPDNSPARRHWGMVFGYWEMVCALVHRGLLNEELFNSCTTEHVYLFVKFRKVIEGFRQEFGYPGLLAEIEAVATRHPVFAGIERRVGAMAGAKPKARRR
jgi:hypothetical protein